MSSEVVTPLLPVARGLGRAESIPWPLKPSSELFELRYGKALVESARRPGSVPVYGTNGQTGTHDTALFAGPGVVLGRKGMGNLGVEWVDDDFWVIDTAYALRQRVDMDLKFAYYLIRHVGLNHLKLGTSNPSLTREAFGAQLFPVPPVSAQRRIVTVLGTLDDKIESNDALRVLLDEVGRTDYVHAVVGIDDRQPLSATAAHHKVSVQPARDPEDEFEHFSIPAFDSGELSEVCAGHTMLSGKYTLPPDAVAVSKLNPATKRVLIPQPVTGLPAVCSSEFVVLRPAAGGDPALLRAMVAYDHSYYAELLTGVTGTTGSRQRVRPSDVFAATVPVIQAADAGPLLARLGASQQYRSLLHRESHHLRAIRDALLPKLVSGKIRVPVAEEIVEAGDDAALEEATA